MSDPRPGGPASGLLLGVEKPARYAGGEWNEIRKDPAAVRSRVVLAFPDLYEIGMSYLGQKILYQAVNARADLAAERVFAPWPDFEKALRAAGEPLRSLESRRPLAEFDVVAFSLLYELNSTNILTMLDLGGVAVRSVSRRDDAPLVVAGGPAAFNPEPLAGIFDAFFIGDGEEGLLEIIDAWREARGRGGRRAEALAALAGIPGVYVPSLYEPERDPRSGLLRVKPRAGSGAPAAVRKRVLADLDARPFPERIIVPHLQAVFDRVAVETARGCPQKCRFCQATSLYAPYREKDPAGIVRTVRRSLAATGYEDASLFALSVGDYRPLERVLETLMGGLSGSRTSLSLSSLRPNRLKPEIAAAITKVRKTGFTLVPEAGTERLRRVINKHLDGGDLGEAAETAFRQGWRLLKLYFMIGLPTETAADIEAIPALVREILLRGRRILGGAPRLHVSLSSFIPKPHTPFQWAGMEEPGALEDKQGFIRSALKRERSVEIKTHDIRQSVLEAVFSRGDRALDGGLLRAWEAGARFDGWSEHFRFDLWETAWERAGLDPRAYTRALPLESVLPWDHMETGIFKEFLKAEWAAALKGELTAPCPERSCGSCRGCEYPGFSSRPAAPFEGVPDDEARPLLGAESAEPRRYVVFYAKEGPARLIGHNDLVNALRRTLRRAGVEPAFSAGFHPKPLLSFGPALPLGMGGREEFFEFRALRLFEEGPFLDALNAAAPAGLRFGRLHLLAEGERSWLERIEEMEYSIDLTVPEAAEALRSGERTAGSAFGDPTLAAEFAAWLREIRIEDDGRRVGLRTGFNPQKIPRPQDLVRRALGLEHVASAMTREGFRFRRV